eukprot:TRINITY_DN7024_c0_g2_i1.p1 TRINITY_DN7024_c0_g2~~TRINITY_DN7024_c0_g2_i1.p1  ORF type:complete len:491 (-),score=60.31 TRINITY_DN7024_c0_g2_i1:51-1523(-)
MARLGAWAPPAARPETSFPCLRAATSPLPRPLVRCGSARRRRLSRVGEEPFEGWSAISCVSIALAAVKVRHCRGRQQLVSRSCRKPGSITEPKPDIVEHWMTSVDLDAFSRDVHQLGHRLRVEQGEADLEHLAKMRAWSHCCAAVGLATMWMHPNLITIAALSLWNWGSFFTMHFVSHGGYNRMDPNGHFSSRRFAQGSEWRRLVDWLDWVHPKAWDVHHNRRHHYSLNEAGDPDFLERNFAGSGAMRILKPFLAMPCWKWAWLSPNSYKELMVQEMEREGRKFAEGFDPHAPFTVPKIAGDALRGSISQDPVSTWDLLVEVFGPYVLFRFLLLPLPLALVDGSYFVNAFWNLIFAEIATNAHSYLVVMPNHTGDDLYSFKTSCRPKSPTFYLRSVISSANYKGGDDVRDFMLGWLNYQIEHHCWPDLSMLAVRKGQPELRKICEKHGLPYIQEDLFARGWKTLEVVTGHARTRSFPAHLEREEDIVRAA